MTTFATGRTTEHLFEEALASSEPLWELRGVVRGLLADGHDREAILTDFERFRLVLQTAEREEDEDTVLEVMDRRRLVQPGDAALRAASGSP